MVDPLLRRKRITHYNVVNAVSDLEAIVKRLGLMAKECRIEPLVGDEYDVHMVTKNGNRWVRVESWLDETAWGEGPRQTTRQLQAMYQTLRQVELRGESE